MTTYGGEDATDRLHQFEVVCRTALKLVRFGSQSRKYHNGSLLALGMAEFGLTHQQVKYCLGRARNFLAEARELECARNKALLKESPTKWSYL